MHFNLYDAAESSGGTSTTRMVILNNGNVGVGTTSPNEKLSVAGTFPASTGASIGCNVNGTIPSSATLFGFSYQSNTSIQDASFTLTNWAHFAAYPGAIGASATVTNQFGVYIDSSLTGATNNYGLYSNIASGSNRWNFYAAGTAQNYFAGNLGIGTTSPAAKLDIGSGNLTFSSTAQRITGDFSNATVASRLFFQNSTTNAITRVGAIPNGTATESGYNFYN
ncbi:MAG: hypothetical protein EBS78_11615, partial [Altererythrobacter sp.]|nr:hypothetical protein [Altererythrobacter sp.]